MKFIKEAQTWRSILGTQTFFWPLTPPPPPVYYQPATKQRPDPKIANCCITLYPKLRTCVSCISQLSRVCISVRRQCFTVSLSL